VLFPGSVRRSAVGIHCHSCFVREVHRFSQSLFRSKAYLMTRTNSANHVMDHRDKNSGRGASNIDFVLSNVASHPSSEFHATMKSSVTHVAKPARFVIDRIANVRRILHSRAVSSLVRIAAKPLLMSLSHPERADREAQISGIQIPPHCRRWLPSEQLSFSDQIRRSRSCSRDARRRSRRRLLCCH
jgi:hypothetical protein